MTTTEITNEFNHIREFVETAGQLKAMPIWKQKNYAAMTMWL